MLEAKAKDHEHKCKCFPKKKGLKIFFPSISKKNGLEKYFSADLQNFNQSKNSAGQGEGNFLGLENLRRRT